MQQKYLITFAVTTDIPLPSERTLTGAVLNAITRSGRKNGSIVVSEAARVVEARQPGSFEAPVGGFDQPAEGMDAPPVPANGIGTMEDRESLSMEDRGRLYDSQDQSGRP